MKQAVKAAVSISARAAFGAAGLARSRAGRHAMPDLRDVESILAIRLNLLGDLLFTLPAVAAIRRAAPKARITMLVLPYTAGLLRGVDLVDRVVTVDVNALRSPGDVLSGDAVAGMRQAVRDLRAEPYDLSVSFYGEAASAFGILSGARFTVGYGAEALPATLDLALPGRRYDSRRHETEYCLDLVRALGAGGQLAFPDLITDVTSREASARLLSAAGMPAGEGYLTMHPGALNMAAKRWPAARWAEVADRIQRETALRVVLVGSASEKSLADAVAFRMQTRPVILSGKTSLLELAAVIERSALFMGGDSGPLHLASALKVPSVSIYGPTDPANTGPLHSEAVVLRGGVDCSPCYDLRRAATCWRGDLRCMSWVSTDEVFEAARSLALRRGGETGRRVSVDGMVNHGATTENGSGMSLRPVAGTERADAGDSGLSTGFKRLLVVKLAGLGDLLTAFPALEALRLRYPLAEVTALVTPQSASLLKGSGLVDRVLTFDKYEFDGPAGFTRAGPLLGLVSLAARLRSGRFDAAVLLHHFITWQGVLKYGSLMLATGAPVRAGLDDGRGRFLNLRAIDRGFGASHEVEYWLEVASLLGAESGQPEVRLRPSADEGRYAEEVWGRLGLGAASRVVAIHPGTGSYSPVRRWPASGFSRVADAIAERGLTPVIVAGPGEEALARRVADGAHVPSTLLSGVPSPRHLAAILSRCALYVGNDSGVTHIAAAAGIPVVAVFGPSNHLAWAPYDPTGARSRIVRRALDCAPCLYRGGSLGLRNGCGDPVCLTGIDPSEVVAAAESLIGPA